MLPTTDEPQVNDALQFCFELCNDRDMPRDPLVLEQRLLVLAGAVLTYRERLEVAGRCIDDSIEELASLD